MEEVRQDAAQGEASRKKNERRTGRGLDTGAGGSLHVSP